MKEILEGAKGLARNPLGIIALFVVLVYGFASLLLGVSTQRLGCEERRPLVWFVVLFPAIVLGVFYRLVTQHHGKLYAPLDYRGDDFLKTLSADQQAARVQAEVESVQQSAANEKPLATTESVPAQSVPSQTGTRQDSEELRARLLEAERLGLIKVEAERGLLLRRQVAFGDGHMAAFDGVASSDTEFIAVEVKYLREPWVSARSIQDIFLRALAAEAFLRRGGDDRKLRLLLVFVIGKDNGGIRRLQGVLNTHLKDPPVATEHEAYFLDDLRRDLDPKA